jgi:hypothetical protein
MLGHFLTREQVDRTMGLPHRPHAPQAAALPPAGGLHWRWRHPSGLATVPVPLLVQKFSRLAASSFALFIPVLA